MESELTHLDEKFKCISADELENIVYILSKEVLGNQESLASFPHAVMLPSKQVWLGWLINGNIY